MEITTVCVIGGGGFVGRHICHQLAARGYRVCVPTRDPERAKQLILLPTVEVVAADVHDAAALSRVVRGADAVINLVGVLHEGRGRASFREAHVGLPRKIIAACRQHGVRRLLHMSALNAGAGAPSAYLRSKGEAEAIARESGLEVTLFRPSVVFGRDDTFLNLFAMLLKLLPMVVLASPNARFQPVFVEDVAAAFVKSPKISAASAKATICAAPGSTRCASWSNSPALRPGMRAPSSDSTIRCRTGRCLRWSRCRSNS